MFAEISENTQLVSVLVRSMDRASLPEALASVAAQSYDSIEVVLINAKKGEHSNVGTWCGRFPLRLINSEVGLTRVAAANTGLEHAQGTYLMFLDDDDLIVYGLLRRDAQYWLTARYSNKLTQYRSNHG